MEAKDNENFNAANQDILSSLLKVAGEYAHILKSIGKIPSTQQAQELQKEIVLPYILMTYGKILTACRLFNGYSLQDVHPSIKGISYDYFTTFDIIRSMYECYLQSKFIVSRYKSDREKIYIGLWWHIRAFKERALMANNREVENNQLVSEQQEIESFIKLIDKKYKDLKDLDIKQFEFKEKNFFNSWPKPGQLYSVAQVDKSQHLHLYKFHSLYAHNEPFAMMQVNSAAEKQDFNIIGSFIFTHSMYVLDISMLALKNFAQVFPEANSVFKEHTELEEMYKSAHIHFSVSPAKQKENLNKL